MPTPGGDQRVYTEEAATTQLDMRKPAHLNLNPKTRHEGWTLLAILGVEQGRI